MKKIARSLREHRELILNYFRAQKLISSGVVEGLNNKAKVTMRKSYGFRTYRVLELALYHSLGKLPEPESTRDFFRRTKNFPGRGVSRAVFALTEDVAEALAMESQFGFDASNCPGGREELLSNSPQDGVRGLLTWLI